MIENFDSIAKSQEDPSALGSDAEIDFGTLIASLATSALLHLGESYSEEEPAIVNLPLAKQSIEIIGMLREKTRGNLNEEEQRLIDEVLYDLRHKFLHVSNHSSNASTA